MNEKLLVKKSFSKGKLGLGFMVHEVARAWRSKIDERVRPLGLSSATWSLVGTIACSGEALTQREIADLLFVEGPTVVRLLDKLESIGWVVRKPVPGDRRMKHVYLTEKAEPFLEQLAIIADEIEDELLRDLPQADIRQACALLLRIRERLGLPPCPTNSETAGQEDTGLAR